ncbi:MAG TPA: glycoside hydrolase family 28 protein, partial [Phycisphaerae bacterium]|nr:glycoside hydrolase family 28 protein [Phycisphaerae bacterium]
MRRITSGLVLLIAMLLLICSPSLAQEEPTNTQGVFNVKNFGATGDGKTLDSPAINKAIDACAAAGGGTVYIPAGTYLSGSIHMKSNINLYIDAGAMILGAAQDLHAYDPAEAFTGHAYQDGGHTYFHNSLIWGENLKNVSVTGHGMINGGGMIAGDRDNPAPSYGIGNKSIVFKLCTNVLIRDVTIFHGGHFAILVTGCNILTIDNVTIDTNRDGMDLDCCQNTTVSNCRVNSPSDDGICPKSTYALGRLVPTENMTITNCQVSGFLEGTLLDGRMLPGRKGNGRIKLGTESNGGFRNITISNCTFRDCYGLALEEVDGGTMENITIDNITMYDVPS